MSTIVRGNVTLDPTVATTAEVSVAPLIPDGKAWKLTRAMFALNIGGAAGTTIYHLIGVVSNTALVANTTGGLLEDESALVLAVFDNNETGAGLIDNYKAGLVDGFSVVDDVYLSPEFIVTMMTNNIDLTASGSAILSFSIELEEVKVTTKIQQAILDSM